MVWGYSIVVQYSVGPTITLHGPITAREYVDRLGNQMHPSHEPDISKQRCSFQDDNAPIHTAGTVQTWFDEHEGELQHLPWPAYSPDMNITEPLWSVLETRARNRFSPPTSLKQLEDILQENCIKFR
jgi:hypothetical protein